MDNSRNGAGRHPAADGTTAGFGRRRDFCDVASLPPRNPLCHHIGTRPTFAKRDRTCPWPPTPALPVMDEHGHYAGLGKPAGAFILRRGLPWCRTQRPHVPNLNLRKCPHFAGYSSETRERQFASDCVVVLRGLTESNRFKSLSCPTFLSHSIGFQGLFLNLSHRSRPRNQDRGWPLPSSGYDAPCSP
jgi:hypothetical protein